MNLLEQCKEIILHSENGYYDKIYNMQIATAAPAICRAVLAAMDEMEKQSESTYHRWRDPAYCNGIDDALSILRKHLEGEKK
ncbi:MAG: hypothetical protein WC554_00470 [Clostridia bacterium]